MNDEINSDAHCFCCDIELIEVTDIRFGVCADCLENHEIIQEVFEQSQMYAAMAFNIAQALRERASIWIDENDKDFN